MPNKQLKSRYHLSKRAPTPLPMGKRVLGLPRQTAWLFAFTGAVSTDALGDCHGLGAEEWSAALGDFRFRRGGFSFHLVGES